MKAKYLNWIEKKYYRFLEKNKNKMPRRFAKAIALNCIDPFIRKQYSDVIGLEMGEGTLANLGLNVVQTGDHKVCVHVGKNVSIAPNVTFICGSAANNGSEINKYSRVQKNTKEEHIYIEDEVWLGAGVTILPGVHIGKCSVIGAGCVVNKNIPEYSVCVGVPVRVIGDVRDTE